MTPPPGTTAGANAGRAGSRPCQGPAPASVRSQLASVVLLAGSVRTSRLAAAIGRSILDLPTGQGRIIERWQRELAELKLELPGRHLSCRIMLDQSSTGPSRVAPRDGLDLVVERDPRDFRGTGGVLRDVAETLGEQALVLVVNAHQLLVTPLADLLDPMLEGRGEVAIVTDHAHTPVGVMLVRCGVLREIAPIGFSDFKEQALPQIAARHPVVVVSRPQTVALPVRTLTDYITALRVLHRKEKGEAAIGGAYAEDWDPAFAVVESDADVASSARIHDSVVLAGARVEAGATVVRSVVCPGCVVRRRTTIIDQIVDTSA